MESIEERAEQLLSRDERSLELNLQTTHAQGSSTFPETIATTYNALGDAMNIGRTKMG